ncbi:MAG TPA: N-acetylglucosamine-6-phosphate deacetylase, partial [Albitalea sp.]
MKRLTGLVLTPRGFLDGELELDDAGRIARVDGTPVGAGSARESRLPKLLPGFIDLHVHGGGGRDVMEGGDAAVQVARLHAARGTTALLATTMTAPGPDLEAALAALGPACATRARGAARILGVHLEGPYINPGKLGAQPDFARAFDAQELARLDALAPIRLVTLAPEMEGHLQALEA